MLRSPGDPVLVGRYVFPLVPLLAAAIAFVARALPRRPATVLALAIFGAGALLQVFGLVITTARFYG